MKWSGDVQVRCHRVKLGGRPHIPIRTAPNPIRVFPSVECSTLRNILHVTYLPPIHYTTASVYLSQSLSVHHLYTYRVVVPKRKMPSKPQQPPKNKNKIKDTPTTTTSTKPTPPNWPPLKPLLPSSTLSLTPLLPNHQILTISHFWTSTLCKAYISFLSSSSSNLTFTTTPSKPKKGEAVRVNDRLQVDDAGFAERLWSGTGLKGLVMGDSGFEGEGEGEEEKEKDGGLWGGEVLGLSSNIRVYRYGKGQFFGRHCEFHLLIDN